MSLARSIRRGAFLLSSLLASCCQPSSAPPAGKPALPAAEPSATAKNAEPPVTILFHPARVDEGGKLVSWVEGPSPHDRVVTLAFAGLRSVPAQKNGKKTYFVSSMFSPEPGNELGFDRDWVHHPAGLGAMLVDSTLAYAAYAADPDAVAVIAPFVDHILDHGRTDAKDDWARVPYACSSFGELTYRGADEGKYCPGGQRCGIGDGIGFLEPDKVGEMGHAMVRLYQVTGEERYLQGALACARALASHAREGDEARSPWPFRVDARTGKQIREEYSANVLGPIKLFDELLAMGAGDEAAFRKARQIALSWLFRHPLRDDLWDGYFEDIAHGPTPGSNPNQYTPLETARYLMLHPELDPSWRAHTERILAWVTEKFTGDVQQNVFEPGHQLGAEIVSEQLWDMAKMASHTARFASVLALFHEKTGDGPSKERAYRSFAWATYACSDKGVVTVSPNPREGLWFSDGYGDYIRHFIAGMASVPEWAPAEGIHVLRSTSPLIAPKATATSLSYGSFFASGEEVIRVAKTPSRVLLDASPIAEEKGSLEVLPVRAGGALLKLRRKEAKQVRIEL